ncbi:hypothetical protein EIN_411080 [Entamoeba invadens IP1]|uniref:Rab-GAP TBC domain-containing protein n=1 Tax=Entamoeba invadens IP1 TaxID=370355 RepID=A0A0A1U168_ENTIV|nr:hypothetical protein EIN_411080 [Entamoeba invadens IP1]ELP87755.1 hypothetical protein EIN_411080 [Entamoeba invadens IP1]|eukprot:XP_004254526.1 hypothetical protein EIN_411080 [Entamoeba invadens IP1]
MLTQTDFWKLESEDSLLKLNDDFLQEGNTSQVEELLLRGERWYENVMKHSENIPVKEYQPEHIENVPEGIRRIIELDVLRTLKSEEYKAPLRVLLTQLWKDFGDYAQAMCLVAAFLRLVLSENKVYKIMTVLNHSNFYIPGYWKAEAVGYASDTYSAIAIAREISPEVVNKITRTQPYPETFCQKFFNAIGIHVFPFEIEFDIMEQFLTGGRVFLFQLITSVMDVQKEQFLNNNEVNIMFNLLGLEKEVTSRETLRRICDEAKNYDKVLEHDIVAMRNEMYEKHLRAKLEKQKRAKEEEDSDDIIDCPSTDDEDE